MNIKSLLLSLLLLTPPSYSQTASLDFNLIINYNQFPNQSLQQILPQLSIDVFTSPFSLPTNQFYHLFSIPVKSFLDQGMPSTNTSFSMIYNVDWPNRFFIVYANPTNSNSYLISKYTKSPPYTIYYKK